MTILGKIADENNVKRLKGVVLAGNHKQYVDFARANGFNLAKGELIYLEWDSQIMGLSDIHIYRVGTWAMNRMAYHPRIKDRETVL